MSVTTTNLIAGPGTLYNGDFGATEPADSAVSSAPAASTWPDVGGTQDGVTLEIAQEFFELEVDQLVDTPGRRRTKRDVTLKTNLAEPTLANLKLAVNGGTITASSGYSSFDPDDGVTSIQPTYKAFIFDGWAPGGAFIRRVIGRKCLSTEGVEMAYKKDGQTLIPVTFAVHGVSSSTKPFRVVDQTT